MIKYVIYSPPYDNNSGGSIVLHKLCYLLRQQGEMGFVWYSNKPHINDMISWQGIKRFICYIGNKKNRSPYDLTLANYKSLKDAVVIYPEVVNGNPLRVKNVVRWFLNKPGVLTGDICFGSNDLFFYYDIHFNDPEINKNLLNQLKVVEIQSSTYKYINEQKRSDACYMVRKGQYRSLDYHGDATCIDNLDHKYVALIFNTCKYFICYDLYTMYSRYAAMCGCIPIVVPEKGMTKEQWLPIVKDRYGIAYGWDDIDWAIETRPLLMEYLSECELISRQSVEQFVAKTKKYFNLNQ
ncbi:MAG: hypothetical protein RQ783_09330 [Gammaproteobacteria bacterium]|nr:hypothetical protein [Gammaproteobacteria bacterium]